MSPWWRATIGNPHSPHGAGQHAAQAVEIARERVARLVGASSSEIIFTSGATEANAIALLGTARRAAASGDDRRRILISAIEHKSVLECAARLSAEGFEVVTVPVAPSALLTIPGVRFARLGA